MKRIPLSPLFALAALPLLSASASTGVTPDDFILSPDLTDLYAGTATSSEILSGYPASNAFDNDVSTRAGRWLGVIQSGDAIGWIRWDFADGPHVVRAYSFMSHVETHESRAPTVWRLEGSNDGGNTWTTIDTVSGSWGWTQAMTRLYVFENETAYSSYRWVITARGSNGDQYYGLQEIELYETASTESAESGTWGDRQDITETIDPSVDDFERVADLTSPGVGTVTYSPSHSSFPGNGMFDDNWSTAEGRWLAIPLGLGTMPDLTDSFAGTVSGSPTLAEFTVAGAFDNDASTAAGRWLGVVQSGDEKAWLRWDFTDGPQAVGGYGFKAPVSGIESRFPAAWTLSGSNDGGATWTLLDSVSGENLWQAGEPRIFFANNAVAYSAYRFSFTATGGNDDYVALSEIELYSAADTATNATGRAWVQIELPEAIRPNGYVLRSMTGNTGSGERCPTAWRLLASNDGVSWTVLDRRVRQDAWDNVESRTFDFPNASSYRFWRLVLDGSGGSQLYAGNLGYLGFSELELFDYDPGASSGASRIRCSPSYSNGSNRHCIGSKAFDGDLTTADGEWMALVQDGAEKAWVSYRFDRKVYVDGYGLAAYADSVRAPIRSPTRWVLYGSNDGGRSWTELDSRMKSAWEPGEKCVYDAASPGRYSLYKFSIIGRGSDASYVGLQEIELYGSLSDGTVILIR